MDCWEICFRFGPLAELFAPGADGLSRSPGSSLDGLLLLRSSQTCSDRVGQVGEGGLRVAVYCLLGRYVLAEFPWIVVDMHDGHSVRQRRGGGRQRQRKQIG